MHAAIHQLLSLRDGEPVDAHVVRHVEQCLTCSAELARLGRVQQRMQSLAALEPPTHAWQRISAQVANTAASRRSPIPWALAATVAVAVASGLLFRQFSAPSPDLAAAQLQPEFRDESMTASLDQLVAQSQQLDQMLQHLPERPAVERVALAATIDTIEARVQWLDQELSYAHDTGLDDAQASVLWRERVDLMDSLVKVRYAEGAPLSF